MKLARAPLEKRNAVADLPLREALASIARPKRLRPAASPQHRISDFLCCASQTFWAQAIAPEQLIVMLKKRRKTCCANCL
jgi:hypothetical protein